MANKAPSAPVGARPVIIRNTAYDEDRRRRWLRIIPACFLSLVAHGLLIFAAIFLLFGDSKASQQDIPNPLETDKAVVIDNQVEEQKAEPNLENEEIGIDPEMSTNYNVDRIEEVSVPGPVDPAAAVGIAGAAADAMPSNIPPPPGIGGGQGGGIDAPNFGAGSPIGLAGGMGGIKMIEGGFAGRSGATREKMLAEGGGNAASEAAVARGLSWMEKHQAPDGHWSFGQFQQHGKCNCTGQGGHDDIAATAFGLLPFLGGGQTHKAGADTGTKYTKTVEKGLKYLISKQNPETGELHSLMYSHGLATIAVCEAYALTSDPQLKKPAQKAIDYIVNAQSQQGGWRYGRGQPGFDTSVGGWQVMALRSGQMAGLNVPTKNLKLCHAWLDAASDKNGGYGYCSAGNGPATTAVGLLCRQYLGWGQKQPELQAGINILSATGPVQNMYYNYYATQVMHHMGGPAWDKWNKKMRDDLIAKQAQNGHEKGSWNGLGGHSAGRIMDTSLAILTLEVYYRHLPLYRRDVGADKALKD